MRAPATDLTLPPFRLMDERGREVTLDALVGQPTVVAFFFSRCPTVCPKLMDRLRQVQLKTEGFDPPVRVVAITVDPEHDSPLTLSAYAALQDAGPRWNFWTGSDDEISRLLEKGFVAPRGELEGGMPGHGTRFALVDPEAHVRGYYDATDSGIDELLLDLQAKVWVTAR